MWVYLETWLVQDGTLPSLQRGQPLTPVVDAPLVATDWVRSGCLRDPAVSPTAGVVAPGPFDPGRGWWAATMGTGLSTSTIRFYDLHRGPTGPCSRGRPGRPGRSG